MQNNKIKFIKNKPQPVKNNQYDIFAPSENEVGNGFARLLVARNTALRHLPADFDGEADKLEKVDTKNDIEFVNDSYAINFNRLWYSLDSMYKPTTWIMSINSVEGIEESLVELIQEKVKTIVMVNVFDSTVYNFFQSLDKTVLLANNLEEAVRKAFYASEPGDTILFSPGVKTEVFYANYHDRGEKFKDAIAQL